MHVLINFCCFSTSILDFIVLRNISEIKMQFKQK